VVLVQVTCSKVLACINLAFVNLGAAAVDSVVQVSTIGQLWQWMSTVASV
jgi:hypothetical protein